MSKKFHFDLRKVQQFPKDEPFVMLPRVLICSQAWRQRSINCIRLIDFLLREHMNHAGQQNGQLMATYDQLVEWGIGRRLVNKTITEAEYKGLIIVERGGRKGFALSHANVFTLTFLCIRCKGSNGDYYYASPSNDWKKFDSQESASQ